MSLSDMIERMAAAIAEQVDSTCIADAAGIVPVDRDWKRIARVVALAGFDYSDKALVERMARNISALDGVDEWLTGGTMDVEAYRAERCEEACAVLSALRASASVEAGSPQAQR